jgi:hypothetical protein
MLFVLFLDRPLNIIVKLLRATCKDGSYQNEPQELKTGKNITTCVLLFFHPNASIVWWVTQCRKSL